MGRMRPHGALDRRDRLRLRLGVNKLLRLHDLIYLAHHFGRSSARATSPRTVCRSCTCILHALFLDAQPVRFNMARAKTAKPGKASTKATSSSSRKKTRAPKGAVGRPKKIQGEQRELVMTRYDTYEEARDEDNLKAVQKEYRGATRDILGRFGWLNPFRKLSDAEKEALAKEDDEWEDEENDVLKEIGEDTILRAARAQKAAKKSGVPLNMEDEAVQNDATVLWVYNVRTCARSLDLSAD